MSERLLVASALIKTYYVSGGAVEVIKGIDVQLDAGETLAIIGPSGAGKSTLLHIIGLLETPTGGTLTFMGKDTARLSDQARARMRLEQIGFVFQFHHLMPEFSALENVLLPALMLRQDLSTCRKKAEALLAEVGLADRINHKPGELSGGEQQRVAIARALINNPQILLADEPTGNLDRVNSERLQGLLWETCHERRTTLVVVTHDHNLVGGMDRTITIVDGMLQSH